MRKTIVQRTHCLNHPHYRHFHLDCLLESLEQWPEPLRWLVPMPRGRIFPWFTVRIDRCRISSAGVRFRICFRQKKCRWTSVRETEEHRSWKRKWRCLVCLKIVSFFILFLKLSDGVANRRCRQSRLQKNECWRLQRASRSLRIGENWQKQSCFGFFSLSALLRAEQAGLCSRSNRVVPAFDRV